MGTSFIGLRRLPLAAFAASALCIAAVSCGTDECYDNRNSLPLAELYASGTSPQAVTIDSISVWGIGVPRDSMILDTARSVSQIYFPFRIDSDETSFVIRYDGIRRLLPGAPDDTISFTYRNVPVFESQACGVFYRFDDVQIDHTSFLIDSVVCPQGYIDNSPKANLKIFFRTDTYSE